MLLSLYTLGISVLRRTIQVDFMRIFNYTMYVKIQFNLSEPHNLNYVVFIFDLRRIFKMEDLLNKQVKRPAPAFLSFFCAHIPWT